MKSFVEQSAMTSPGKYTTSFDALPNDVGSLLAVVRGLFVHGDYLSVYGFSDTEYSSHSRETLALEKRLDQIFQKSDQALAITRPVDRRVMGSCRDYAVMICGMLRHKSLAARVRCGFAQYFVPGRYEDHWVCEYWRVDIRRWVRVDAQLDEAHCDHLGIAFDTSDLPDGAFVSALEAWNLVRSGKVVPQLFGHGDAAGEWFMWVNLARDCLSLQGVESSPWDSWRSALGREPEIDDATRALCDRIAVDVRDLEQEREVTKPVSGLQSFWSTDMSATSASQLAVPGP